MLPPKLVRILVGATAALVGLSALALAGGALFAGPRVNWVLLGFEVVTLAAAIIGLLFARAKFHDAPGLALACVAGTVFVAAVLGYMGSDRHLVTHNGSFPLRGMAIARVLAALFIGILGAGVVLTRTRRSLVYLGKAAVTGGPVLLLAVAFLKFRGQLSAAAGALPGWATIIALVIGGTIGIVLISASIHLLIRAFEEGRTEEPA